MESHPYKKTGGVGVRFLVPNPKRAPGVAAAHKRRHLEAARQLEKLYDRRRISF